MKKRKAKLTILNGTSIDFNIEGHPIPGYTSDLPRNKEYTMKQLLDSLSFSGVELFVTDEVTALELADECANEFVRVLGEDKVKLVKTDWGVKVHIGTLQDPMMNILNGGGVITMTVGAK